MEANMDDCQTRLINSEQRRIELSQELQRLMSHNNKSDRLREIQLKSQMERFTSQRQQSLQRNQMIRRQMQEFEINMSSVTAKTQALRNLKNEYEEYIERLYPQWKEQVLAAAARQRDKDQRLSSMRRDVRLSEELPVPNLSPPQQFCHSSTLSTQLSSTPPNHTTYQSPCSNLHCLCSHNQLTHSKSSSISLSSSCTAVNYENNSCSSNSSSTLNMSSSIFVATRANLRPLRLVTLAEEVAVTAAYSSAIGRFTDSFTALRSLYEDGYTSPRNGYAGLSGQHDDIRTPYQTGRDVLAPPRSSTPEYSRATTSRPDRGHLSSSLQSVNSEKSVTFDESTLKPPTGHRNGVQRAASSGQSRNSPRRHTPSPSELIRSSLEFGDSSSQGSTSNVSKGGDATRSSLFTAVHPAQSSRVDGSIPNYQTAYGDRHSLSNQHTDQPDYSPYTRVSQQAHVTGSPAHSVTGSPAHSVTGPPAYMSGVTGPSEHPTRDTLQRPASPASTESVTFNSIEKPLTTPRRLSGHEVVIPSSAGDVSDDGDSLVDSVGKKEQNRTIDHTRRSSNGHTAPPASTAPVHSLQAPDILGHSMSSLNSTTATEEPQAIDFAKTDEFKTLLGGQTSARAGYDSDDSEDSLDKAIENEYSKQLALKTNTLPMQGPITLPTGAPEERSPEEDASEDDEELTSPMGYTPSFASNMKPAAGSKAASEFTGKYTDSLAHTMSSTGGSKNSSGSQRAAIRRTNSDVESESDFPASRGAVVTKAAEDDMADEFFFG